MTRNFTTLEQVTTFLLADLFSLYDSYKEEEGGSDSYLNYLEGCIDRTQVVLAKCGVEYMEYDTYIETVGKLKWIPA